MIGRPWQYNPYNFFCFFFYRILSWRCNSNVEFCSTSPWEKEKERWNRRWWRGEIRGQKTKHGPDDSHIHTVVDSVIHWTNLSSECRNLYAYSVINTQETKRDRRHLKERSVYSRNCNKLHKTYMPPANIWPKFTNSGISGPSIDAPRPFRDPYRLFFKSQLRCQNPYFELDTEQDAMRKLFLIKRGGFHCIIFGTCLLDSYLSFRPRLFKSWIVLSTG